MTVTRQADSSPCFVSRLGNHSSPYREACRHLGNLWGPQDGSAGALCPWSHFLKPDSLCGQRDQSFQDVPRGPRASPEAA